MMNLSALSTCTVEGFQQILAQHNEGKDECHHCFCELAVTAGPAVRICCHCNALVPAIYVLSAFALN